MDSGPTPGPQGLARLRIPLLLGGVGVGLLLALGAGAVWIAELVQEASGVPSILVVTTLALVLAQLPVAKRLRGARLLGMFAVYLFLGGVGAGAYTIAAVNFFLGKSAELSTALGLSIGCPALLVGSLFLLADLGSPRNAVLAGMRPGSSWIARGFWIISAFMVVAFAHSTLYLFSNFDETSSGRAVLSALAVLGGILLAL